MKKIPAATFRAILAYTVSFGHSEIAVLRGTGVNSQDLVGDSASVTPRAYRALVRNGMKLTGQPHLGLGVGRHSRISDFSLFGYALMSCSTLGAAAGLALRYWSVTGAAVTVSAIEDETSITWRVGEAFPLGDLWVFACERWASAVIAGTRANTGNRKLPHLIEFNYPAPPHVDRYAEFLRCEPLFDRPFTQLTLPKSVLKQPNLFSNQEAAELCARRCEALAANSIGTKDRLVVDLRDLLVCSAGQYPSLKDAAASLHLSDRSLRRRLAERGLTFQAVLDDTRAEIAADYLRGTQFTIEEIAGLLGFSEPTNFSKAFKKWMGVSATEFRGSRRR
jgi:AraC-like DNA-binding protein